MTDTIEDVKIAVIGNVDSGKCLAAGTLVLMHGGPDGNYYTKAVQFIEPGDLLVGDNFQPRLVLETTSGSGQLYNVHQSVGETFTVNANHILVLYRGSQQVLMTVSEYMKMSALEKFSLMGARVNISERKVYTHSIGVQPAKIGQYHGFELDGNRQFLLADGTITHNSTIIGTLLCGKNDDGRGENREIVMNYPHEKETGQTSSVGYQILGFREDASIIHIDNRNKKESWPKIIKETKKLVTFMDLAGHEKYLKTTVHGLSSNHPDYALILVEGRGVRGMTREHIMLALSFGIPFIILVTKVDLYGREIVAATMERITKLIKSSKRDLWLVRDQRDIEIPLQRPADKLVTVFCVSSVSGQGLDLLKEYLFRLPKRIDYSLRIDEPFEMAVIEGFMVHGVGTVAHGFLVRGTARVGDTVWLGPDSTGTYHKTRIRTIQFKRLNVDFVLAGHHCTVSLPGIDRNMLRHGVYILHNNVPDRLAIKKFTADIKVLTNHTITIRLGYCPLLHMNNIRMAARVVGIDNLTGSGGDTSEDEQKYLRGGDRARVQFLFMYRPAFLRVGDTFIFREGRTRGLGTVVDTF